MELSGHLHALVTLSPSTHWIGGSVGLRASLNVMEKGKFVPVSEIKLLGYKY
jgi:hypothetical protein